MRNLILRIFGPLARRIFYYNLFIHTDNYSHLKWLGTPIWQAPLDLWTIQETISEVRPDVLIETGTNRGGSALFYAHLFDLMNHGRVITVDMEKMHELSHPRITFLLGSSIDEKILEAIRGAAHGRVMVILDSDHTAEHVGREMEAYAPFVTSESYMLVQDGSADRSGRTGPLRAIKDFLPNHPEFEVDKKRCNQFLVTHHPFGWLKRR